MMDKLRQSSYHTDWVIWLEMTDKSGVPSKNAVSVYIKHSRYLHYALHFWISGQSTTMVKGCVCLMW